MAVPPKPKLSKTEQKRRAAFRRFWSEHGWDNQWVDTESERLLEESLEEFRQARAEPLPSYVETTELDEPVEEWAFKLGFNAGVLAFWDDLVKTRELERTDNAHRAKQRHAAGLGGKERSERSGPLRDRIEQATRRYRRSDPDATTRKMARDLAAQLGLPLGTVRDHLRRLGMKQVAPRNS